MKCFGISAKFSATFKGAYAPKTSGAFVAYGGALVLHGLRKEVDVLYVGVNERWYNRVCEIDSPVDTPAGPCIEYNEGLFIFPVDRSKVEVVTLVNTPCLSLRGLLKHYEQFGSY